MRISAVICNYNGGDYLRVALESVLEQERPADEIVVVDDASTDRSGSIAEAFARQHPSVVRFVQHSSNRGQGAGFNSAVRASSAELICFLDSDDVWQPSKLRFVEQVAAKYPDFGLMQHNLRVMVGDQLTDEACIPALSSGDLLEMWRYRKVFPYFAPTSAITIRRAIFERIAPVPESLRISADSYLTRASLCHGHVVSYVDEFQGVYRRHYGNNVLGNRSHDSWQYFWDEVAPHLKAHYKRHGVPLPRLSPPWHIRYSVAGWNVRRVYFNLRSHYLTSGRTASATRDD